MNTRLFIIIVLLSGCFAGVIHGMVNLAIVEPYLDEAIGIENQNLFESGEEKDTPQFWVEYNSYRVWQKSGQVLAGAILGTSFGALFGLVFSFSKKVLPGNYVKKAIVLSGLMWFVVFFIPFLKYPANPPTVGDPETIILRSFLFISFIAISSIGAIGFYQLSKKFQKNKKILSIFGYALFISLIFFIMPSNPDVINAPMDLVNEFRIMSVIAVTIFWIVLGLTLGGLWQKFNPEKLTHEKIH